jgi:repressor of nif and glnA expression
MSKTMFTILAALNSCEGPLSSQEISQKFVAQDMDLPHRVLHHHSPELDETGRMSNKRVPGQISTEALIMHLTQRMAAIHDGYWSVLKEL